MTKEKAEQQIGAGKEQVRPVHSSLHNEGKHRRAVTDFFEDARNHPGRKRAVSVAMTTKAICHARATPTNP